MGPWRAEESVTKAEAIVKIKDMAKAQGLKGTFKVFYNDEVIADPNDLPESVDMLKVKVSAVLDQA